MTEGFIEISGIVNVIAGVTLLAYWYSFALFLPYRELSSTLSLLVKNRNWTLINAMGVLGALSGLLGQAGIFVAQIDKAGWVALIGFFVASAGTTLLIGTMLWETILWPILYSARGIIIINGRRRSAPSRSAGARAARTRIMGRTGSHLLLI